MSRDSRHQHQYYRYSVQDNSVTNLIIKHVSNIETQYKSPSMSLGYDVSTNVFQEHEPRCFCSRLQICISYVISHDISTAISLTTALLMIYESILISDK